LDNYCNNKIELKIVPWKTKIRVQWDNNDDRVYWLDLLHDDKYLLISWYVNSLLPNFYTPLADGKEKRQTVIIKQKRWY